MQPDHTYHADGDCKITCIISFALPTEYVAFLHASCCMEAPKLVHLPFFGTTISIYSHTTVNIQLHHGIYFYFRNYRNVQELDLFTYRSSKHACLESNQLPACLRRAGPGPCMQGIVHGMHASIILWIVYVWHGIRHHIVHFCQAHACMHAPI